MIIYLLSLSLVYSTSRKIKTQIEIVSTGKKGTDQSQSIQSFSKHSISTSKSLQSSIRQSLVSQSRGLSSRNLSNVKKFSKNVGTGQVLSVVSKLQLEKITGKTNDSLSEFSSILNIIGPPRQKIKYFGKGKYTFPFNTLDNDENHRLDRMAHISKLYFIEDVDDFLKLADKYTLWPLVDSIDTIYHCGDIDTFSSICKLCENSDTIDIDENQHYFRGNPCRHINILFQCDIVVLDTIDSTQDDSTMSRHKDTKYVDKSIEDITPSEQRPQIGFSSKSFLNEDFYFSLDNNFEVNEHLYNFIVKILNLALTPAGMRNALFDLGYNIHHINIKQEYWMKLVRISRFFQRLIFLLENSTSHMTKCESNCPISLYSILPLIRLFIKIYQPFVIYGNNRENYCSLQEIRRRHFNFSQNKEYRKAYPIRLYKHRHAIYSLTRSDTPMYRREPLIFKHTNFPADEDLKTPAIMSEHWFYLSKSRFTQLELNRLSNLFNMDYEYMTYTEYCKAIKNRSTIKKDEGNNYLDLLKIYLKSNECIGEVVVQTSITHRGHNDSGKSVNTRKLKDVDCLNDYRFPVLYQWSLNNLEFHYFWKNLLLENYLLNHEDLVIHPILHMSRLSIIIGWWSRCLNIKYSNDIFSYLYKKSEIPEKSEIPSKKETDTQLINLTFNLLPTRIIDNYISERQKKTESKDTNIIPSLLSDSSLNFNYTIKQILSNSLSIYNEYLPINNLSKLKFWCEELSPLYLPIGENCEKINNYFTKSNDILQSEIENFKKSKQSIENEYAIALKQSGKNDEQLNDLKRYITIYTNNIQSYENVIKSRNLVIYYIFKDRFGITSLLKRFSILFKNPTIFSRLTREHIEYISSILTFTCHQIDRYHDKKESISQCLEMFRLMEKPTHLIKHIGYIYQNNPSGIYRLSTSLFNFIKNTHSLNNLPIFTFNLKLLDYYHNANFNRPKIEGKLVYPSHTYYYVDEVRNDKILSFWKNSLFPHDFHDCIEDDLFICFDPFRFWYEKLNIEEIYYFTITHIDLTMRIFQLGLQYPIINYSSRLGVDLNGYIDVYNIHNNNLDLITFSKYIGSPIFKILNIMNTTDVKNGLNSHINPLFIKWSIHQYLKIRQIFINIGEFNESSSVRSQEIYSVDDRNIDKVDVRIDSSSYTKRSKSLDTVSLNDSFRSKTESTTLLSTCIALSSTIENIISDLINYLLYYPLNDIHLKRKEIQREIEDAEVSNSKKSFFSKLTSSIVNTITQYRPSDVAGKEIILNNFFENINLFWLNTMIILFMDKCHYSLSRKFISIIDKFWLMINRDRNLFILNEYLIIKKEETQSHENQYFWNFLSENENTELPFSQKDYKVQSSLFKYTTSSEYFLITFPQIFWKLAKYSLMTNTMFLKVCSILNKTCLSLENDDYLLFKKDRRKVIIHWLSELITLVRSDIYTNRNLLKNRDNDTYSNHPMIKKLQSIQDPKCKLLISTALLPLRIKHDFHQGLNIKVFEEQWLFLISHLLFFPDQYKGLFREMTRKYLDSLKIVEYALSKVEE